MSILPEDVMAKVEEKYKTRESRAVAIELLTAWRRMPSWTEKNMVGDRHGRSGKTVHKIVQELQEMELFTEDQGSIPLYRVDLAKQTDLNLEQGERLDLGEDVEVKERKLAEVPLISPAGYPTGEESEEEEPPQEEAPSEELSALRNKVFRMEAQLDGLGKKLDNIIPAIQGLSAKTHGNPESSSVQQILPVENLGKIDQSGSVEDRLERIEQLVQKRGEQDPFADLDRDQILELIRSQPKEFMAMVNPDGAGRTDRVEAQAVTLRPLILMLTTYSLMLYERAVFDGYFDGTLSDFANFAIEQYFTDRGWSLDWNKREPASRRRRLG